MTTEMPTRVALGAELRALMDRLAQSNVPEHVAQRSREMAEALAELAEETATRAGEAWHESAPLRDEAERTARRYGQRAARWSKRTWRHSVKPAMRDAWRRRVMASAAAGAAIPAGRELLAEASRMGRREPDRHWGTFFIGLLVGAAAGAAAALLLAPQKGSQTRSLLAERAKEASAAAEDWRAVFQRTNGNEAPSEMTPAPEVEASQPRPTRSTRKPSSASSGQ